MRLVMTTAAALLALSVSAQADGAPTVVQPVTAQPVAVQAPAAPEQKKVKLICRVVFHEGMVLRGNDCRTQAEWDRQRREQERAISDFQEQSYSR